MSDGMQLRRLLRLRRGLCLRAEPLHDQPYSQDHLLYGNGEVEHYLRAGQHSDGLKKDQQTGDKTQNGAGQAPDRQPAGNQLRPVEDEVVQRGPGANFY